MVKRFEATGPSAGIRLDFLPGRLDAIFHNESTGLEATSVDSDCNRVKMNGGLKKDGGVFFYFRMGRCAGKKEAPWFSNSQFIAC